MMVIRSLCGAHGLSAKGTEDKVREMGRQVEFLVLCRSKCVEDNLL